MVTVVRLKLKIALFPRGKQMPKTRSISLALFLTATLATIPAQAAPHAKKPARQAPMQVAITFDDLPVHASLPPGVSRTDVAKSIIHALKAYHAPPIYGFVNATWIEKDPSTAEVLRLWRAAGFPLGNHPLIHMDANANSVEAFEQNILADEPTLEKYMAGKDWRWLRFPYLNAGDTPQKRKEIADFLADHKYRAAMVTLSFGDYAYNDTYARCMAKGDKDAVDWMKQNFLDRASIDLMTGKEMSEADYGRDIKHVLLMHIGAFDAAMLPKLLDMYQKRGVKLISLPDAESDPAYKDSADPQIGFGGVLLEKKLAEKGLSVPVFANKNDDYYKLAGLCK
jgi:peptidoglycan/xylan/chitin deacetylase (PgdA/CDA1 family)